MGCVSLEVTEASTSPQEQQQAMIATKAKSTTTATTMAPTTLAIETVPVTKPVATTTPATKANTQPAFTGTNGAKTEVVESTRKGSYKLQDLKGLTLVSGEPRKGFHLRCDFQGNGYFKGTDSLESPKGADGKSSLRQARFNGRFGFVSEVDQYTQILSLNEFKWLAKPHSFTKDQVTTTIIQETTFPSTLGTQVRFYSPGRDTSDLSNVPAQFKTNGKLNCYAIQAPNGDLYFTE